MKFSMESKAIKDFSRALVLLSKQSNTLFIETKPTTLLLKSCSLTQTAMAVVTLDETFFMNYEPNKNDDVCKIPLRSLMTIFKGNKMIEGAKLWLDTKHERFVVELVIGSRLTVTHRINLLDADEMDDYCTNSDDLQTVSCQPSCFNRLLNISKKGIDELSFQFKPEGLLLQNFVDHDPEDAKFTFLLNAADFLAYEIEHEQSFIVNLTDFVEMIEFAVESGSNIQIQFKKTRGTCLITNVQIDVSFSISTIQASIQKESPSVLRRQRKKAYEEKVSTVFANLTCKNSENQIPMKESVSERAKNKNEVMIRNDSKSNMPVKRKSTDMSVDERPRTKATESPKRRRTDHDATVLTQMEQDEVLDILTQLEAMDANDHDDDLGNIQDSHSVFEFNDMSDREMNVSKRPLNEQNYPPESDNKANASQTNKELLKTTLYDPNISTPLDILQQQSIPETDYYSKRQKPSRTFGAEFRPLFSKRVRNANEEKILVPGSDSE